MRIVDSSPCYKLPVTMQASIKVNTNAKKHQTWKSPWYYWTRPVSQSCCNHCKRGLITLSIWFLRRSDWKIQNSLISTGNRVWRTLVSEDCPSPSMCSIVLESLMFESESVSEGSMLVRAWVRVRVWVSILVRVRFSSSPPNSGTGSSFLNILKNGPPVLDSRKFIL